MKQVTKSMKCVKRKSLPIFLNVLPQAGILSQYYVVLTEVKNMDLRVKQIYI